MPYDPMDAFRVDPGEGQLTEEAQADLAMEQALIDQMQAEQPETTTPTGEQQTQPTTTTEPTGEANSQKYFWEEGYDIKDGVRNVAEGAFAAPAGLADFGVDLINMIPGVNLPKIQKFENEALQSAREITSVIGPMLLLRGGLSRAGTAAHSRVGWKAGDNAFVKWAAERGVEGLSGLAVGAVTSQYETDDNLSGTLKKSWPKTYDFIPDSWATIDGEAPDDKRLKNIKEDVGLGFITGLAEGAAKFASAIRSTKKFTNKMVGETSQAKEWIEDATPDVAEAGQAKQLWNTRPGGATTWDELTVDQQDDVIELYRSQGMLSDTPQDAVVSNLMKQESALDEVGTYNYYKNNLDFDQPLKGVHDTFDYSEIGTRTVDDFGIVGASIDQVRIVNNYDTVYGRLGNVISEPALKYATQGAENTTEIVLGLADQLRMADEVGMIGKGWKVSFKQVMEEGAKLATDLFDPRMSVDELKQLVEPLTATNEYGVKVLTEEGYAGVFQAMRGYVEELSNMDITRAQAYMAGSAAGRVSDIAEGARLMDGTSAVEQAEDKIIDLLKYLLTIKGTTSYYAGRKLNMMNLWKRGFKSVEQYSQETKAGFGAAMDKISKDADRFANTMKTLKETNPELMKTFMLAYEMTDGKISSQLKLSRTIDAMTSDIGKGIINLTPEIENVLVSGMWSNIYNSMLSAFATPIAALTGNFGGVIAKPMSLFAGAALTGDLKTIQRGWMAYSAVTDTLGKALPYMGSVFRKASQDPESVRKVTRLDLALSKEERFEFLRSAADAAAAKGEYGLQYLVDKAETMDALAKNPLLRFGPNALTALDGMTNAMIANANARFEAIDQLVKSGKPVTRENVKRLSDEYYSKMFNKDGVLTDEAAKYAADEISLNLDTPLVSGMNDLLRVLPVAKPFVMFPTTGMNMVDMGSKYAPFAVPFQRDVNQLAFTPLRSLVQNEEYMDELLMARNVDVSKMDTIEKANRIAELKAETLGRKAIGALAVTAATGLLLNDRITGDGLYDKEAQRNREKQSNWKARSIKGLDGKYYSYEFLGPLADWIAFVANVGDNFDMLGESAVENLFNKAAFILGAAITDRTVMSGLQPMFDALSGNGFQAQRWAAGFVNSLGPLGGQRSEWSRLFSDGMRELDYDFQNMLNNRNRFIEHLDPTNRLPYLYSPITGKVANKYGFLQRLWNAYSPIKVHEGPTPEQEFLQEIEYDVNTSFKTRNGIKLTQDERSELFRIMGEQGYFRDQIKAIMKDAKDFKTIARLRKERKAGYGSEDIKLDDFDSIHIRLNAAQRSAEQLAYSELDADMMAAIESRIVQRNIQREATRSGFLLDENLNIRK